MPLALTTITYIFQRPSTPVPGKGDIPNPNAWQPYPVTMGVGAPTTTGAKGDIPNPEAWALFTAPVNGPTIYANWSGYVTTSTPQAFAPGTAALAAGKTGVVLIVVGQQLNGDFPTAPTYGGNAPDVSLTGANGEAWMFLWDLSTHAPANDTLDLQFEVEWNALVVYGVSAFTSHNTGFHAQPVVDTWPTIARCMNVGAAKRVGGLAIAVASDDAAAVSAQYDADPFNNGAMGCFWQSPTDVTVNYTWSTADTLALQSVQSIQLS